MTIQKRVFFLLLFFLVLGMTEAIAQQGMLPGVFSVSYSTSVRFSKGNLQYNSSTSAYRFANKQWDYVGEQGSNIPGSTSGWMDLFYWGETDAGHHSVSNGGNTAWRALSTEEWWYVFKERYTESGIRYSKAKVNGFNGVILLPDDWNSAYYALVAPDQEDADYNVNTITASQWNTLEQHGAVFLPAAGWRGVGMSNFYFDAVGTGGSYLSSSDCVMASTYSSTGMFVRLVLFDDLEVSPQSFGLSSVGVSVRLVSDVTMAFPRSLASGWNWFSSAVEYDQNSLAVLEGSLASNCSSAMIKTQSEFVTYGAGTWNGQLPAMDNAQMYMIMVDHEVTPVLSGHKVNPQEHPVTLSPGWNWVGFPLHFTMTLQDAFLNFTPANGDLIKGKAGFSSYDALSGTWTGQLQTLEPGEGYLYLSNRSENVSLEFYTLGHINYYDIENVPQGAVKGVFSVGDNKRVLFSQGNLQYIGSSPMPYWKFSEHQWDIMGDNGQGSNTYNANRDLFGWGTSGYNHGATAYRPWSTSQTSSDYYAYGSENYHLYDQTGKADWGYNAIRNGGNTVNTWRTPTLDEWWYVLDLRETPSGIRYTKAQVNGVNGLILLPDDWRPCYYPLFNNNYQYSNYESNRIDAEHWNLMEQHGAVFLPASGYRIGTSVNGAGFEGLYWSSSKTNSDHACCFYFSQNTLHSRDYYNRYEGYPVRLIRPLPGNLPQITTSETQDITSTSATCGGVVISDGGQPVYERGVCWSTNHNPTVNGGHVLVGAGTGAFVVEVTDRLPNTTYYVRAYATNVMGTVYGNEVSFTTLPGGGGDEPGSDIPEGAVNGLFSVSETQQVMFSQGNLQYMASTDTWRFAENQWDKLGGFNSNISPSFNYWIDLFGWGTSGYNHGAVCYQPWSTSTDNSQYDAYGQSDCNLFDQTGKADWGYNAISNGGNATNLWRTLTYQEWNYVFYNRYTTSGILWTRATVCDTKGIILLPDDWSSSIYVLNGANGGEFEYNVITADDWVNVLEAHGAVFLPAAGYRSGTTPFNVGYWGTYWSSTHKGDDSAYYLLFDSRYLQTFYYTYASRSDGQSVRLVRNVSK